MKVDISKNLAIHFPLTQKLIEEKISLSDESKEIAKKFIALSRDLSPHDLEINLYDLLSEHIKSVANKRCKVINHDISRLQEEHERYFYITRYEDNTGDLVVENILQSYLRFLSDYQLGSRLTPVDLGHIDGALKSLMQYLIN